MVTTSGFSSAPLSRFLILALVLTTLAASIFDVKYLLPIKATPHLWPYLQISRLFTFQLAYISSTELLFAVSTLYHVRVLERLWGSRKFGSFVVAAWVLCGVSVVVLGVFAKVITFGQWGYIPPGLTGLIFALLAVWRGEVPGLYGVNVLIGSVGGPQASAERPLTESVRVYGEGNHVASPRDGEKGIVLSDKFTTYLLAAQLALSQFPYQLLPALVGWIVGVAWREELLPTGMIRWRIPGWLVGDDSATKRSRGQYEGLRRRLEEEGGPGDGMREVSDGFINRREDQQRRGFGGSMMGYFTGS